MCILLATMSSVRKSYFFVMEPHSGIDAVSGSSLSIFNCIIQSSDFSLRLRTIDASVGIWLLGLNDLLNFAKFLKLGIFGLFISFLAGTSSTP